MKILVYFVFLHNLFILIRAQGLEVKEQALEKNMQLCKTLAKQPYFEPELVIGKPWRIYFTWNMQFENKCLDILFKNATPAIIHRVWSDMYEYMDQQPYWDSAVLYATMGPGRHEMLLFPAQGGAGSFFGVPNVIRGGGLTPVRNGVPLLQFQMKVINNGKYLVMFDCHTGLGSLSARGDRLPYRTDLAATAAQLDLGDGFPACTQEKNKDEQIVVK